MAKHGIVEVHGVVDTGSRLRLMVSMSCSRFGLGISSNTGWATARWQLDVVVPVGDMVDAAAS